MVQVTSLFCASSGSTVATSCAVLPTTSSSLASFRLTLVTVVAASTVTSQVAENASSSVFTVIVALPAATAVIVPSWSTDATAPSLLLKTTFCSVASSGTMLTIRVAVSPSFSVTSSWSTVMPVNATASSVTVTSQTAFCSPSSVVTVIVALPAATAVTSPFSFTVATASSLVVQLTFWLEASIGFTAAARVYLSPITRLSLFLFRLTPSTGTSFAVTVTSQVSVNSPSSVVTVIFAVPAVTAVTLPFSSTFATSALSLLQLTFLLLAPSGATVAVSTALSPVSISSVFLSRVTPVTGVSCSSTVTSQVAVNPPSSVFTVTIAVPAATALTLPFSSTVATAVSLLVQVTFLLSAPCGATVSVRVAVSPTARMSSPLSSVTPVTAIGSSPFIRMTNSTLFLLLKSSVAVHTNFVVVYAVEV